VLVFLAVLIFQTSVEAKNIRLRHETINTDSAQSKSEIEGQKKTKAAVSGLYLVQFNETLAEDWRDELKQDGVELIRYVPDDAYVARFHQVKTAALAEKSFVRWFGPYRGEYKIQPRLAGLAKGAARTNASEEVNILLAPDASAAEIASVRAHLKKNNHESHLRQGVILRGELNPAQLEALAQSSSVLWIERAATRKLYDEAASKIVGGDDGLLGTPTVTQQLGFDGAGVIVSVADTGLDTGDTNTMHPDLFGRVTGFMAYGSNITDGSDGYGHGTHCAGIVAGNAATGEKDMDTEQLYGLGVAPGAKLFIQRLFDDDATEASPFPTDETITRDAVRAGAKIGSNSWGNDSEGEYDLDAMQFDALVRDADAGTPGDQPYILEFSAGNSGPAPQTIGSPACAKNVIATGASQNAPATLSSTYGLYAEGPDAMADFSSRGPCADGRIKPDVVAPGTWIASAASAYALDPEGTSWTVIDGLYVYMGGTSMAGPHVSGAAAVFVQFYQATHANAVPSPALTKAALINSADELDQANGGPSPVPNNDEGWGRVNLETIITTNFTVAPRAFEYVDQNKPLTNGQVFTQHIFVRSADEPLKVTLAYTDVPGFPGALPALVNDLDLEVIAPEGTRYRGNQFGAGESVPNAPTPDKLNNVEGVFLAAPAAGDYEVRVRGTKIVSDALTGTAAVDQDFALVSSGDLARRGAGIILLDRPAYTAPGSMNLTVFDAARAASNSVSVTVTNHTLHTAVTQVLNARGNYGAFTGAVATVTGAAGTGQIQIANGNLLSAIYLDAGGNPRSATAVADLVAPGITSVAATTDLGVMTITWQTGEPATSIVRYGTNSSNLNLGVTNLALVTSHAVKLTGLLPEKNYYYLIVSADAAGNTATNNNGGSYYTFIGATTPTVLLVDAYDTAAETALGATVIPDSAYTNVLAAAGISFGFWKVNQRGTPQLGDLKPFPVVIWRTTDDINYGYDTDGLPDPTATNNTLNAQQQYMIQSYLNGGGSFFLSSMEILSRLGNVPFRRNVLQVAGFTQNTSLIGICEDCDEDRGVPGFFGLPGGLASGMSVALNYTNYPLFDLGFGDVGDLYGPDFSDTFTPAADATAVALESVSGRACGMSYPNLGVDSPGRVVFLAFPFDTVPTNGPAPNNAVAMLKNIIRFLAPGVNGVGVISLNNTVYTTNTLVTVEVGDSDLAGTGQTQVSFAASSHPGTPVSLTLSETTHPGLFRGTLALVNGGATTNQLQVIHGDLITATYFDVSGGSNVIATASVDTVPPGITNVAAVTDYYNARVTWTTSKPADSAVHFGRLDQPPINSVYDGTPVTNHTLTLNGLLANRDYHFQVVSRDQAGNTTVDDNSGNYYTFTTRKGLSPPWFDNLENGTNGWTVVGGAGTETNWTMGKPNNTLATSAYSGTNVWGSNLKHQPFTYVESYLYSPPIDLAGLSQVKLKFRGKYNLTSTLEYGELGISTNSATPPAAIPALASFTGGASGGWEEETIDLSQFSGMTIQVVWYYAGVTFSGILDGWLIDDISITGGGTANITKNLSQGNWSLWWLSDIDPVLVESGNATNASIGNLKNGQYVVQFGAVPYYNPIANQTNTVTNGSTIHFTGNYTLPDANSNNIADGFEWHYFGNLSTNRTQFTDTDGDGMTDYAEFIAGTIPTNAASRLYFTSASVLSNQVVELKWMTVTNRLYQVNASTNLTSWSPLSGLLLSGNNTNMSYAVTNSAGKRFYRVQVLP